MKVYAILLFSIMIILILILIFFKYEIIFIQLSMITHFITDCIIDLSISYNKVAQIAEN